jgi:hypothetical protein
MKSQIRKYTAWLTSLILLSLPCLHAQSATNGIKDEKGKLCWVVATSMPKDLENPLKILAGEKLHEVKMRLRSVGKPVKIDNTGIVRAVKVILDAEGNETYQNLSQAIIPEGVTQALLVLVPIPESETEGENGLRFRSKVIDLTKFKKGGFLYVNLTKAKLGVKIGNKKTTLETGEMKLINALDGQKEAVLPVQFVYRIFEEDKWRLMVSSKMAVYDSRREICIFYYNDRIKNVDFRGIPFITPTPKKGTPKP